MRQEPGEEPSIGDLDESSEMAPRRTGRVGQKLFNDHSNITKSMFHDIEVDYIVAEMSQLMLDSTKLGDKSQNYYNNNTGGK